MKKSILLIALFFLSIAVYAQDNNVRRVLSLYSEESPYKDLFVNASRGMDLIRSDTLLVVVDANNAAIFESPEIADHVEDLVIIDHHRKTAEFKKNPLISYIEPSASSACELVAEMLEQVIPTGMLDEEDANALLAGNKRAAFEILSDMKIRKEPAQIVLSSVSRIASELLSVKTMLEAGMNPVEIGQKMRMKDYPLRLRIDSVRRKTAEEISLLCEKCYEADITLKSSGADAYTVLENLILYI